MTTYITREEAIKLLKEIGHISNISVPVVNKISQEIEWKTILNYGSLIHLFSRKILRGSSAQNAEDAMKIIVKQFRIEYSDRVGIKGIYLIKN